MNIPAHGTLVFSIISMFIGTIAFGQSVQIDTLQLKESERFNNILSDRMNFPLIRTGDREIDSIINNDLKIRITSDEYINEPLDSALIKWAGDQMVYLDFEVTFNEKGILSFRINAEGCGAYCSNWTDYFNYSTTSGKWLDISEIIDTTGEFPAKVKADLQSQFNQQKKDLKEMLSEPEAELEQSTYEWALKYYLDCEDSFDLETFAIYPDRLEIVEHCYLPNAIKNLTPIINLEYNYTEIKEYLRI